MKAIRYTAAGGVVVDRDRVMVLHRPSRSEVRLPKGHLEKGETAQQAALREVIEESGYADPQIVADLGLQIVEFDSADVHVIRDERYFMMVLDRPDGAEPRQVARKRKEWQFIPDWLSWDQALDKLTFEAEREWVRRARQAADQADR